MGARRRCCCDSSCWYFADDFGDGTARNNTTDLGANWNEETGDWGIIAWNLVEDFSDGGGTAEAKLFTTRAQPADTAGRSYMGIDIADPQTGDKYYLYPCCPDEETKGPIEAVFECTSAPSAWRVTIGDKFMDMVVDADGLGWREAWCCVDHEIGQAKAWMNYGVNGRVWNDDSDPGTGRYSGLGHDNPVEPTNLGARLDNYFVGELFTETGVVCYDCFCRCRDEAPKREMTATVVDATGRYACANGADCTIQWNESPTLEYWHGVIENIEAPIEEGYNGESVSIDVILRCGSENPNLTDGQHFTLSIDISGECCEVNQDLCHLAYPVADELYTHCEDFTLRFGPYRAARSDLLCFLCYNPDPFGTSGDPPTGSFFIDITL